MTDEPSDGLINLGVAAGMARLYQQDQREFANGLATMLETSLPDATSIVRKGGLFSEKKIASIEVHIGDDLYVMEIPARGPLQPARSRVVRGIKLRTEPVPIDQWIAALAGALEAHAKQHGDASRALKEFLGQ